MSPLNYEPLDHTGDLGWIVRAPSWDALLANASLALSDTLVDLAKVEAKREVKWTLQGSTREALLVRQLEEILFQFDARGMVFSRFEIHLSAPEALSCRAWGEELDRHKHSFKTEIKAVTYHQLKVEEVKDGSWRAQVILDV